MLLERANDLGALVFDNDVLYTGSDNSVDIDVPAMLCRSVKVAVPRILVY